MFIKSVRLALIPEETEREKGKEFLEKGKEGKEKKKVVLEKEDESGGGWRGLNGLEAGGVLYRALSAPLCDITAR